MQQMISITKAMADESRLRVLCWLRDGELCLCQIVAMLSLAPSTVSRHMAVLQQCGLVVSRKDGRWVYYHFPGRSATTQIKETHKWLKRVMADDPALQADLKKLTKIRSQDPSQLCEITYGKSE